VHFVGSYYTGICSIKMHVSKNVKFITGSAEAWSVWYWERQYLWFCTLIGPAG